MTKLLAQIKNPVLGPELNALQESPNSGEEFLARILPNAVALLLIVGGVTFFAMLVIGAVQWITSGGDKANLEAARGRISSALIGVIVLFSTFAIIKLIEGFFGVEILNIDLGPLKIN